MSDELWRNKKNDRVELEDSFTKMAYKISEGNPGALDAMKHAYKASEVVDTMSAFKGLTPWISLDSFGIYGSKIWSLYNMCGKRPVHFCAVLRCVQMGMLRREDLIAKIDTWYAGDNIDELREWGDECLVKMQARLPSFKNEYKEGA